MRKLVFLVLLVSLVVSLAACDRDPNKRYDEAHLNEVYAMLRDANVGITSFVYDGSFTDYLAFEAQGSGVLFKESNGYVYALTNYHVVNPRHYDYAEYYIQLSSTENPLSGQLIAFDKDLDLAVLRFEVSEANYSLVNVSLRAEDPLQQGEFVLSFGRPEDTSYYQGEYLGMVSIDEVNFNVVHHTANVVSGFSGGALTDIHGNLIGINTWSGANNAGLAVSINEIYSFLVYNNLLPE